MNGRLAMTRSLGDLDLKSSGVIAEPETKRIKVREDMKTLETQGMNAGLSSATSFLGSLK